MQPRFSRHFVSGRAFACGGMSVVLDLDRHHEPKLDSSLHKLDEANRATIGKQGWGVKRGCDPFQASRALSPIIIL